MIPEQPLLLTLLALMAVLAGIGVYRLFRRLGRRGVNGALGLGVLAVACMVVAQKPSPPLFFFDDIYIYDGGSYATNDTVHVELARRVMELPIDDCDVIAFMRERGSTNAADYVMLPTYKFGEYPVDFTVANATNYNYWFYLDYVPPSPVHTNGVFELRGFVVPSVASGTRSAAFATSSAKILPPTARDYVQDGLIAMWDGIDHGNDPLIWRDISGNGYDATQRVATGWSWADKSYVGVGPNNGFRVPQTFSSALRDAVEHHTVELVFKPNSWRRQTIFGQYNGNVGAGLNYEFYSRPQSFRAYYYSTPDYSVEAWSSTQMQRMTVAVVCDGSQLSIYVDGVKTGQSYQPTANTIHEGLSMIIGGENNRTNMSIGGALFCVRVYSRALTEEELKHHVKIDNERFDLP